MKILLHLLAILFLYITVECAAPEVAVSPKIKYELSVTTPSFTYEKSIHNEDVITSREHAFSITILSDIPVLRSGTLNISPETYYFWMDGRGLERIEPGAFDNQNITEEIRLEYNKLRKIQTGTFRDLKIKKLDLSYNRINQIEDNAFSNLPNLVEIYLGRNEIAEFSGTSFLNTPKLWSFEATFNKLTKLKEESFSFMKKGEAVTVAVSHNHIEEIDPKAFDGISVWNMDLAHNKLKEVPEEVFSKNAIVLLNLNNNRLKSLPQAFYEQKNLTTVNLKENPLHCDEQKKLTKLQEEAQVHVMFDNQNC